MGDGYTKRCSNCQKVKRANAFARQTKSKDGLQSWCKACQQAYVRTPAATKPTDTTVSRPKRGARLQRFERWLLNGVTEGFISADEARRLRS